MYTHTHTHTHCRQLIKSAKQFIENGHKLMSGTARGHLGEANNISKQNAVANKRTITCAYMYMYMYTLYWYR